MLLRVDESAESGRRLHVLRRSGEVVEVSEQDIVKLKLIPAGRGTALRAPAAWEKGG